MGAVFVSYRRGDSEGQARALSLELVKLLGKESVFMDVDSIGLGRDFREVLQKRLESCEVLIALIGPDWLSAMDSAGRRRLDDPTDFVRQEIAAALKRNVPVIPVLVQGAPIPSPDHLPEDLKHLSYRNGFELGHATWESDVREMVKRLGLEPQPSPSSASPLPVASPMPVAALPATGWRQKPIMVLLAIAGIVAFLALSFNHYSRTSSDDAFEVQTPPTPGAEPSPAAASPVAAVGFALEPGTMVTEALPSKLSGPAFDGLAFDWPGGDCWNISRGNDLVTYQCGAKKQALGPGRYTISARGLPVFLPFEIEIKAGAETRVALGGVVDFRWPGDDCWDVLRDDEPVTYQCGAKRQALAPGRYTLKGRHAPVFLSFAVEIKNRTVTRIQTGGVFTYNWKGTDCWDIVRGEEVVTYQCGTKKQALGAGSYTIKARHAPVFEPFAIKVTDGAQIVAP